MVDSRVFEFRHRWPFILRFLELELVKGRSTNLIPLFPNFDLLAELLAISSAYVLLVSLFAAAGCLSSPARKSSTFDNGTGSLSFSADGSSDKFSADDSTATVSSTLFLSLAGPPLTADLRSACMFLFLIGTDISSLAARFSPCHFEPSDIIVCSRADFRVGSDALIGLSFDVLALAGENGSGCT